MDPKEYKDRHRFVKAFVKGPTGSGKTVLAASASRLWRTLYLDVNGGLVSAFTMGVVKEENLKIRLVQGDDYKTFKDSLNDAIGEAWGGEFQCVVLDMATDCARRMTARYADAKEGRSGGQEWYGLIDEVIRLGRIMRDVPAHTIVLAHTKPAGDESGPAVHEPSLPSTTAEDVPALFDVIGTLRIIESAKLTRVLSTTGPGYFKVRDRTNSLLADEPVTKEAPENVWKKLAAGVAAI